MNWRDAYLTQAWSDFLIFREMNRSRYPTCHALHYLQMATEKLAKDFMCKRGPYKPTHYSLVKFLHASKTQRAWREQLDYKNNPKAFGYYIDSILPVADQIQNLAPVWGNFNKVNPEYPWEDSATGDVNCPCAYDFSFIERTNLANFQKLVHRLFQIVGFEES